MKKESLAFEKYPYSTILATNLVALLIWIVGIYLVWQVDFILAMAFILYLLVLELSIYKQGCARCYYYGKRCAFGRGKIAQLIVKKDDPKKFCQKKVTCISLLPTILASLIPIIFGVIILIKDFSFFILILTILPLINWFLINPLIFGKLVCFHCKQGRLCCPANDFFGKKHENKIQGTPL